MKANRRNFLKSAAVLSLGTVFNTTKAESNINALTQLTGAGDTFELPKLGYSYDALEPFIDAQTMEIHYTKHHQAYVNKLNEAIAKNPQLKGRSLDELLAGINKLKIAVNDSTAIVNNGGGHWNHSFFWTILKKDTRLGPLLSEAINRDFGSMDAFKEQFEKAATGVFGSGWAWLMKTKEGKLEIRQTRNQHNHLTDTDIPAGSKPLLGVDVWEHAYYLKYQNKRADYLKAFWNVANWEKAEELYVKK